MPESIDEFGLIVDELKERDLQNVQIPYILKNKILMSPGMWNNYFYDSDAIKEAFRGTEWNAHNMALFLDHMDDRASEWVGEIRDIRIDNGGNLIGDVHVVDQPTAIKLAYGAKFGVSPKIMGEADSGRRIFNFKFENFSIVINPAVKTTYLNSEIKITKGDKIMPEKELQEIEEENKEVENAKKDEKKYPYPEEMAEMKKMLAEIADELKKKKYPYPEEQKEKKKYPYPEKKKMDEEPAAEPAEEPAPEEPVEEGPSEEEMAAIFENSAYTEFVGKYIKEHKGEAPIATLMKRAAKAWKEKEQKSSEQKDMVQDVQKEVDKMIEQKFAELKDPGMKIAQKFLEPSAKHTAEDLDRAVSEVLCQHV